MKFHLVNGNHRGAVLENINFGFHEQRQLGLRSSTSPDTRRIGRQDSATGIRSMRQERGMRSASRIPSTDLSQSRS